MPFLVNNGWFVLNPLKLCDLLIPKFLSLKPMKAKGYDFFSYSFSSSVCGAAPLACPRMFG